MGQVNNTKSAEKKQTNPNEKVVGAMKPEPAVDQSTRCRDGTGNTSAPLSDIFFLRSPVIPAWVAGVADPIYIKTPALNLLRGCMTDVDEDNGVVDGGLTLAQQGDLIDQSKKQPKHDLTNIGRTGFLRDVFKVSISKDLVVDGVVDLAGDSIDEGHKIGRLEIKDLAHIWYDNSHTGPILFVPKEIGKVGKTPYIGEMHWESMGIGGFPKMRWRPVIRIPDPLIDIPKEIKLALALNIDIPEEPIGREVTGIGTMVLPKYPLTQETTIIKTKDVVDKFGKPINIENFNIMVMGKINTILTMIQKTNTVLTYVDETLLGGAAAATGAAQITQGDVTLNMDDHQNQQAPPPPSIPPEGGASTGGLDGPIEIDPLVRDVFINEVDFKSSELMISSDFDFNPPIEFKIIEEYIP